MTNDIYSSGPFNRVYFMYTPDMGLQTYRYKQHNLNAAGTLVKTITFAHTAEAPGFDAVFERTSEPRSRMPMLSRVQRVMQLYGCDMQDALIYMDLRDEGYSAHQAAVMAGLADPGE